MGKKTLHLVENGSCENLHESIISAFPALTFAGGYELLRIDENYRRMLEIIPSPPSGYTAEFLKECVHHAKIYIRPVQRSLSEEVTKPTDLVITILIIMTALLNYNELLYILLEQTVY